MEMSRYGIDAYVYVCMDVRVEMKWLLMGNQHFTIEANSVILQIK